MLRKMTRCIGTVLVLAGGIISAQGQEESGQSDKTLAPYFHIDKGEGADIEQFPLGSTGVTALINGVIAEVTVLQKYRNNGKVPINGQYVFPASMRAAVHGMTMRIGEKVIVAKVKERAAAKAEFEQAKAEGKSASLLEQQRPNVFTMSVSNIMPGDNVEVELHYTEYIAPEAGTYEFMFPTVVGPRYSSASEASAPATDKWVKSPFLHKKVASPAAFTFAATIATGIPLSELTCTTHKMNTAWEGESVAKLVLETNETNASNRDVVVRYRLRGKEIQSGLLLYEDEHEKFFQLTVQPPERIASSSVLPREYVFIVDVSGSMNGFPLTVSKQLLKDLITNLTSGDLFNVVLFAGTSNCLAERSLPATYENLQKAVAFIDQQNGSGGTELAAGLERAFSLPTDKQFSRNFVVVTDGYISGEREAFALIRKKLDEANVFAFGIGTAVNRYLVEGIAKAGLGEAFVALNEAEASEVAARFRTYISSPLLTNVQVQGKGVKLYAMEPAQIPDLLADRPLVLFGKYDGAARGSIVVTGTGNGDVFTKEFDLGGIAPSVSNKPLRYLWARTRIAAIDDFAQDQYEEENVREVTSLGLTYNLLTRYTSLVAVLEEVRNTGDKAQNVDQPLPLPQNVSEYAVGGSDKVPEPGLLEMALLLTGAMAVLLRRKASPVLVDEHRA